MWLMHDGWGWWMVFGVILMILFWGGLITLIVWAIGRLTRHHAIGRETPLEIARERYARRDNEGAVRADKEGLARLG